MAGYQSLIAEAVKAKIEDVTTANGHSMDVGVVAFDRVKLNIGDYRDFELPAVQIIDLSSSINHEMSRSKTAWFLAVEICMRTTTDIGTVDQQTLWDFQEDVIRAVMADPRLGLTFVVDTNVVDKVTDLHMLEPNYISTIGFQVTYYEPITRSAC